MEVWIRRDLYGNGIGILFSEKRPDGKRYVAKPVELEFEEAPLGVELRPTIFIPHFLAPQFLQAMAESLDKHGIKTDKDAKIQGTLEATRYHLEDMRKLLNLKGR